MLPVSFTLGGLAQISKYILEKPAVLSRFTSIQACRLFNVSFGIATLKAIYNELITNKYLIGSPGRYYK